MTTAREAESLTTETPTHPHMNRSLLDSLRTAAAASPGDTSATKALALVLLRDATEGGSDALLDEARTLLQRVTSLDESDAFAHAALGHAWLHVETDGAAEAALAAFDRAHALDPDDAVVDAYRARLFADLRPGTEADAAVAAAAARQGIDLPALRAELIAAGFPTDARTLLMNGFVHGPNFFAARLREAAEAIERAHGVADLAVAALDDCAALQRALAGRVRRGRVPAAFRALTPLAQRFGIGDDGCRSAVMAALPPDELAAITAEIDAHAHAIDAWLGAAGETMTEEQAAFMYLLLAVEEARRS